MVPPRRLRRNTALIAMLVLVLAACGGGSSSSEELSIGADEFLIDEFRTLDGETIDLQTLQGQDVVLWFWAPW